MKKIPGTPTADDQLPRPEPAAASSLATKKGLVVPDAWKSPTVKMLSQEHPQFTDAKDDWVKIGLLYKSGRDVRKNATQFLRRRPRELQEVYQARVDAFIDRGILPTALGWYRAALFKNPPTVEGKTVDSTGGETGKISSADERWYSEFRKNCDKRKTSLLDVVRDVWTEAVLYGVTYLLLDLPEGGLVRTMKDQQKIGVLDDRGRPQPYLTPYNPLSVINWDLDAFGNLNWVVIAVQKSTQDFVSTTKVVDTWYYFDREKFLVYERERRKEETATDKLPPEARATLVNLGYHALRSANMVPLLKFEVPDSLYLGNRVFSSILAHLNQDNSYAWALFMSNLAMPVISSDQDFKPTLSEVGFIKLPTGAKYEWSEPSGRSFATSAERVKELREDIYRAMYLTYQGRDSTATADGASGASKEMDMMPATDVMNEFGDIVIAFMQNTLDSVSLARGDKSLRWDVRGLSFGKTLTLDDIQNTEATLSIGVPSDTFEKETFKQFAAGRMPDANPEIIEKISSEIDAAPSQEERMAAQAQQRTNQYKGAMDKAVTQFNTPPQPAVPKKKRVGALT